MLEILAGHMTIHHMVAAEGRPTSCGPAVFPAFASACISVLGFNFIVIRGRLGQLVFVASKTRFFEGTGSLKV